MSDPKRWLDEGNEQADDLRIEREVLRSGVAMNPPPGMQDAVWSALGAKLGTFGGPNDGGSSSPTSTAANTGATTVNPVVAGKFGLWATLGKGLLVTLVTAAVIAGGYFALNRASEPPQNAPVTIAALPMPAPEMASSAPVEIAPPSMVEAPPPPPVPADLPSIPAPHKPVVPLPSAMHKDMPVAISSAEPVTATSERAGRLREESRALAEAREALRSGNAAGAIERLDVLGGRYPDGILAQEREALAIEALFRAGKRDEAQTRAAAFLRAYPSSPHATKIRAFLP